MSVFNNDPLHPFSIPIPPYVEWWEVGNPNAFSAGTLVKVGLPGYKDDNVAKAVITLAVKVASFKGDPNFGPLAESIASELRAVVRNLLRMGA
jgi:hypothetical protein